MFTHERESERERETGKKGGGERERERSAPGCVGECLRKHESRRTGVRNKVFKRHEKPEIWIKPQFRYAKVTRTV